MRDKIWVTRDKRRMLVSDMETSHVKRAIAMIERSTTGWRRGYLERLRIELIIRSLQR